MIRRAGCCCSWSRRCIRCSAQVTFDRILKAKQEPQNWLTYSGGVLSQRHSELTQITPENVKNLELQWMYPAAVARADEQRSK